MATNINNMKEQVFNDINKIVKNAINELTGRWLDTFDGDVAINNLNKLVDHSDQFFQEIIDETDQRRQKFMEQISAYRDERDILMRRLNTKIDINIPDTLPLFNYLKTLDASLNDLREQLKNKEIEIEELLESQTHLCMNLGYSERNLSVEPHLPSDDELNEFRSYLEQLKSEQTDRLSKLSKLKKKILFLSAEMELSIGNNPAYSYLHEVESSLSKESLKRLEDLYASLNDRKLKLNKNIADIKSKLVTLWNCLEVDESVRSKFNLLNKCSESTEKALLTELNRCETLKRQNVKRFVEQIRKEIIIYWDKMKKTDIERARFPYFNSDQYTEDLLTLHEIELNELRLHYETNKQIFDKFDEHKTLWDELVALEAKRNEPGRFNNRGGKLLKEEKERNIINAKLPKIKDEIIKLATEYNDQYGKQLLIWGIPIGDAIAIEYEKRKIEKEQQMSARKAGLTPMSTTKLGSVSTVKRVASTTNLLGSVSGKKQKMQSSSSNVTGAKRNLLGEYLNINLLKKIGKSPAKRVISTLIEPRRQSQRYSGKGKLNRSKHNRSKGKSKRKSENRFTNPEVIVTNENESISYDEFHSHMSRTPKCRSSAIQSNAFTITKETEIPQPTPVKSSRKLQTPGSIQAKSIRTRLQTPARVPLTRAANANSTQKMHTTAANVSVTPAKRQVTKNLPLII